MRGARTYGRAIHRTATPKSGWNLGGTTPTSVCTRHWRWNAESGEIQVLAATGLCVPHRVRASAGSGRRAQSGSGDDEPFRDAAQGNRGNRDEPPPSLRRRVRDQPRGTRTRAPCAYHSGLQRFLVARSGDGRFRRVGCSVVAVHVGFQRNRPAPRRATRSQRQTLWQVDRDVQLQRICRPGPVVPGPAR